MPDDPVSVTPKYLIGAVTKLTGLSIDVVRVWERRYGAVRPVRSAGGTRLYSDADVLRLNRLHRAVERGYGIGQAARLSETELDELIASPEPSPDRADPYQSVRQRFIAAIRTMDVVAADQELTRAAALYSPAELVKRIVSPILNDLSERKALKEFGVGHDRAATGLVRRLLESLIRLYRPSGIVETIVLATPAGEIYEFDLLLSALLAAVHGWRVVYLGADVQATEIGLTVRLSNARVLALDIRSQGYRMAEELETISTVVDGSIQVWITGAADLRPRVDPGRATWLLVRDLEHLDELLRR